MLDCASNLCITMPQASIRFNLQMISEFNYTTMPSSNMDKSEAALRREGAKLEEDFTRLSTAKTAAEKKEIFWSQETTRLGKKVVLS